MSRTTLCRPPDDWNERIKELNEDDCPDGRALLEVELALELMAFLNLDAETALAVPAVLSATPMLGRDYTAAQRLAIANVRQITAFSASSAWRTALADYRKLPDSWRHYDFSSGGAEGFPGEADDGDFAQNDENAERDDYEKRLICVARKPDGARRHQAHNDLYQKCLTEILPFRERNGKNAGADISYTFRAEVEGGDREEIRVQFPPELLKAVNAAPKPRWFDSPEEKKRGPLTIRIHEDLAPIAAFFDAQDAQKGRKSSDWRKRLAKLRYRPIGDDGKPDESAPDILPLNGFHHAAGMVASGKSTLASLIAGYVIKERPDLRVTLVFGDVQTALRQAHQLNSYFRDDPENDAPVAVPLLGRSQREKHLRDLHAGREWQEVWENGETHWGERFLSVACPLKALIPDAKIAERLAGRELKMQTGQEPCAALTSPKPPKKKRRIGESEENERPERRLCSLYSLCPSHRAIHDMPTAPVWLTTPQAMTQATPPRQAENRFVHLGEIIYEHSDLVIFDEADAVMGVLDEIFAHDDDLSNGRTDRNGGVYDRTGMQTERFAITRRASLSPAQQRWSHAQRGGQSASQGLLALLREEELPLRRWVARKYFTPHILFGRIARRLAGCTESLPKQEEDGETRARITHCRAPFDKLFGRRVDPLNPKRLRDDPKIRESVEFDLWMLLRDMDADSGAIFNKSLLDRAQKWILRVASDYPEREIALRQRLCREAEEKVQENGAKKRKSRHVLGGSKPDDEVDTLERLAYRLIFALTAALLDRHTNIIFQEWRSRTAPDEDDTEPHQSTPKILRDILPLPPLGRQFGTYYSPGDESGGGNPNRLSFLSYTNIGRWYLLHFHELYSDLRQRPGPNVLALSGTSYLPHSVRLHVGAYNTKPQGLLLPEAEAADAIGKSEFTFLPIRDDAGKAIRISGAREGAEKTAALQTLAQKLAGGHLRGEFRALKEKGAETPNLWGDRERILLLVNSYDQSQIVAHNLREVWHEERDRIFHLSRPTPSDKAEGAPLQRDILRDGRNSLFRGNIETFGTQTDGRILVAPMNAIGRGYNILNRDGRAAFGAIYFLIRPYPHPDDMTALARELNRRTLDWAETENFAAWNYPTLEAQFYALRREAAKYWNEAQWRSHWRTLTDDKDALCLPRKDLAAHTAGLLVQAAGRLLRGGVPFRAYFIDAAFAPKTAQLPFHETDDDETPPSQTAPQDTPKTSLLSALITLMRDFVEDDPIAKALYEPLVNALLDTRFREGLFPHADQ